MPKQFVSQLRRERHAGSWPTAAPQYALYTIAAVLRIDLSLAHVASLTTPISTSAQVPSAPEQNFTSAQSYQVTLEGCSSVTRHPFHASICSRSPELNLQLEQPFHGQTPWLTLAPRHQSHKLAASSVRPAGGLALSSWDVRVCGTSCEHLQRTSATTGMRRTATRAKRRV